ncbi:hypothetical protein T10_12805 [Trichinella papuae]|uniref:Uncharacterized protein n=1 Tax=Trichinella papuae TaxID=268474 RepID=A0A0V1MYR1_9BILA|nr:hypothetical protein T10_12805 [Trichinella papuae]
MVITVCYSLSVDEDSSNFQNPFLIGDFFQFSTAIVVLALVVQTLAAVLGLEVEDKKAGYNGRTSDHHQHRHGQIVGFGVHVRRGSADLVLQRRTGQRSAQSLDQRDEEHAVQLAGKSDQAGAGRLGHWKRALGGHFEAKWISGQAEKSETYAADHDSPLHVVLPAEQREHRTADHCQRVAHFDRLFKKLGPVDEVADRRGANHAGRDHQHATQTGKAVVVPSGTKQLLHDRVQEGGVGGMELRNVAVPRRHTTMAGTPKMIFNNSTSDVCKTSRGERALATMIPNGLDNEAITLAMVRWLWGNQSAAIFVGMNMMNG